MNYFFMQLFTVMDILRHLHKSINEGDRLKMSASKIIYENGRPN